MRGRIEAAGQQKRQRPAAVLPQQTAGAVPFERAGRKELRKQPVLSGLAPVAVAAQPAQVIRCEGSEHCGWAQRTRDLYCQSVIDLVRLAAAHLAERFLNLLRMLAGCDAVCVQAVAVPARPDVGGRLVAPATDAVAGWLFPTGRAIDEPSAVVRGVTSVVQHEAAELALSDRSSHVLPRLRSG